MSNPLEVRSSSQSYQVHIGQRPRGPLRRTHARLGMRQWRTPVARSSPTEMSPRFTPSGRWPRCAPPGSGLRWRSCPPARSPSPWPRRRPRGRLRSLSPDWTGMVSSSPWAGESSAISPVSSRPSTTGAVPFVQIPTTVIAQCDSAIGGKTGVNTAAGKNLLGAFHPPVLVLADVETLTTLPDREFNEGFAEVIKHGVIRDRALIGRTVALRRDDGAGTRRHRPAQPGDQRPRSSRRTSSSGTTCAHC